MLLEVSALDVFYGDFQALFGIDFCVEPGEVVALVGANGAGKTTFLKALSGLVEEKRGRILFAGSDISRLPAEKVALAGLTLVPEGRLLFSSLTVEENLLMGAVSGRKGGWTLERIYSAFPLLGERRRQMPDTLSGGQQGFVAIARGLMANPDLLLCDEISLGLAPVAIDQIYASFANIRSEGTSLVIVEQDVQRVMAVADRVYCLLEGRVALEGRSGEIGADALTRAYFGG